MWTVYITADIILMYDHSGMHIKFELIENIEMSQHLQICLFQCSKKDARRRQKKKLFTFPSFNK